MIMNLLSYGESVANRFPSGKALDLVAVVKGLKTCFEGLVGKSLSYSDFSAIVDEVGASEGSHPSFGDHNDYIGSNEPKSLFTGEKSMGNVDMDKRFRGQFFTIANPFDHSAFWDWWNTIPDEDKETLLEPFAGANNIVEMLQMLGINSRWDCYDVDPVSVENNKTPEFEIRQRDTLKDFPTGYKVGITNPPYLAKNSAARRKIPYEYPEFGDLYKKSLDVMLSNLDYVAAIIPESFITANMFHDRLYAVVSLTNRMFDDTDCPVCLALFSPADGDEDFYVYARNEKQTYLELTKRCEQVLASSTDVPWRMNDPNGTIGMQCIDGTSGGDGIRFTDDFEGWKIVHSSRSYTRISGLPEGMDANAVMDRANEILRQYRAVSQDVFMTSFKNLRKDGLYRRRIDFGTVRRILSRAVEDVNGGPIL